MSRFWGLATTVVAGVIGGLLFAWWTGTDHPMAAFTFWVLFWTPLFYWFGTRRIQRDLQGSRNQQRTDISR